MPPVGPLPQPFTMSFFVPVVLTFSSALDRAQMVGSARRRRICLYAYGSLRRVDGTFKDAERAASIQSE